MADTFESFGFSLDLQKNKMNIHDEPDRIQSAKSNSLSSNSIIIETTKNKHFCNHETASSTTLISFSPKPLSKNVSLATELVTANVNKKENVRQLEQLISDLSREKGFQQLPALKAAKFMVDDCTDTLIELAAIYLFLKHEKKSFPKGEEIVRHLESDDVKTEGHLMLTIIQNCNLSQSISLLQKLLSGFHQNWSICEKSSLISNTDEVDIGTLPEDMSHLAASLTFGQENLDFNKGSKVFSEEQKYFLKLEALKREQSYLKNSLTCVTCKQRQIDTMLLPCGHVVLCSICSDTCYICPVCKKTALAEVKTYLS